MTAWRHHPTFWALAISAAKRPFVAASVLTAVGNIGGLGGINFGRLFPSSQMACRPANPRSLGHSVDERVNSALIA